MYWTYNSIESILEELHDIHFRGVKLSESLLLAKRFNLVYQAMICKVSSACGHR